MPIFGDTIETPQDLFVHKLGAALKMEATILEMLPQLEERARDPQLQQALKHHYQGHRGTFGTSSASSRRSAGSPTSRPAPRSRRSRRRARRI
jgi:hypothetical protein